MVAKREGDVPRRDLLDIEQAEAVEAADHLADMATALAGLVRNAVDNYRIARGQDAGNMDRPWTVEEILAREG